MALFYYVLQHVKLIVNNNLYITLNEFSTSTCSIQLQLIQVEVNVILSPKLG